MSSITITDEETYKQLKALKGEHADSWNEFGRLVCNFFAGKEMPVNEVPEPTGSNTDLASVEAQLDEILEELKDLGIFIPPKTADKTAEKVVEELEKRH